MTNVSVVEFTTVRRRVGEDGLSSPADVELLGLRGYQP